MYAFVGAARTARAWEATTESFETKDALSAGWARQGVPLSEFVDYITRAGSQRNELSDGVNEDDGIEGRKTTHAASTVVGVANRTHEHDRMRAHACVASQKGFDEK